MLRKRLGAWWRGQSSFTQHLLKNIVIAFLVGLFLRTNFVQDNATVARLRTDTISWEMNTLVRLGRGIHGGGAEFRGDNLVWIDINENAYQEWGARYMTRRDKLRDLIAFAVKGKPRAVIVDIDLADANAGTPADRGYDAALRDYLQHYARSCTAGCPTIILTRSFEPSQTLRYAADGQPAKRVLPSFLDPALGTSPARPWATDGPIVWASIEADAEPDQVIRRWRMWEVACDAPGASQVFPSAPLLVVALLRAPPGANPRVAALKNVEAALEKHATTCTQGSAGSAPERAPEATTLDVGYPLVLTEDALQRLIVYEYEWAQPGSSTEVRGFPNYIDGGQTADNPSADPTKLFEGKAVIIGGSFKEGGDLHATPVGVMPGSLIVVNEMNSLLQDRELKPNELLTNLVELTCIVLISWIFAVLPAAAGTVLSVTIVVVVGNALALFVFRSGIWVDTVVPLAAVILHEIIDQTHERAGLLVNRVVSNFKSKSS